MSRLYRNEGEYGSSRRPIDEILADGIDDLARTSSSTAIVLADRFDASLVRMVGNEAQLAEMRPDRMRRATAHKQRVAVCGCARYRASA